MVQHITRLHQATEEAQDFLTHHQKQRDHLLKRLDIEFKLLCDSYRYMSLCDEISLKICFNLQKTKNFQDHQNDFSYALHVENSTSKLTFYSNLFQTPNNFKLDYYQIPKRYYKNDQDLRSELTQKSQAYQSIELI